MKNPMSPKIVAGAISGALVVIVAMLNAIGPDLLTWAGDWAPVIAAGIAALTPVLAGYAKPDMHRDAGVAIAANADDIEPGEIMADNEQLLEVTGFEGTDEEGLPESVCG